MTRYPTYTKERLGIMPESTIPQWRPQDPEPSPPPRTTTSLDLPSGTTLRLCLQAGNTWGSVCVLLYPKAQTLPDAQAEIVALAVEALETALAELRKITP